MMIDKVGGVGPGYEPRKTNPTARAKNPLKTGDNVRISDEANFAAMAARTARIARSSIDNSRTEKLREVKIKLDNGEYDNPSEEMLSGVADKITGLLFDRKE